MPVSFESEWHDNARAQLIYPSHGVMILQTHGGYWVVPPLRGCWLPARYPHRVRAPSGLEMHSVYWTRPPVGLPATSGVVAVSPLMRETILGLAQREIVANPALAGLLQQSLAAQIRLMDQPVLALPEVKSKRLRAIQSELLRNPRNDYSLEDWARVLGSTSRTLARAFQRETRITFTEFRRQVRLHAAIERLAGGASVSSVAYDVGHASCASFVTMFRRATGKTPRAYFTTPPVRAT